MFNILQLAFRLPLKFLYLKLDIIVLLLLVVFGGGPRLWIIFNRLVLNRIMTVPDQSS